MHNCVVQNDATAMLPLHRHDDARIIIVLDGEVHETDLTGSSVYRAGECLFRPPFCAHANAASRVSSSFLRLPVSRHVWTRYTHQYGWRPMHGKVNLEERDNLTMLSARNNGDDFVTILAEQSHEKPIPNTIAQGNEAGDRIGRCVSFGALAAADNIKPYQLTRRFIRKYSCTPTAYRREFRLRQAYSMLGASDCTLVQIAAECGFADQSHLSREIKLTTGRTPLEFRVFAQP